MPDDVTSGTHPPSLPSDLARAVARELLADLHPPISPDTPTVVAGATGGDLSVSRIGPYEVLAPLGRGGMGSVYRARDTRLGRIVALKVFDMSQVPPSEATERTERFRREANALAKLGRHPHLVQVHELGSEAGRWYFSMDLVEGATLRKWLSAEARTPREVASMVQRVALGLAHAHAHGVIHRDVKPENVFVGQDGEPQLGDFGLVRDLDASHGITEEGQVMGTVAYMAPEQALGAMDRIGPWTDVHALGVILYEGLTGAHPFEGCEKSEILAQVLASEPVPLRRRNPRTAPDLEAVVMRCLEKDPARRYPDAGAIAADLARWLDGEPVSATRLTPAYWMRKKLRRHRRPILAAASLLVLFVFLSVFNVRRDRARREEALARARELIAKKAAPLLEDAVSTTEKYFWKEADSATRIDAELRRELDSLEEVCHDALGLAPDLEEAKACLGESKAVWAELRAAHIAWMEAEVLARGQQALWTDARVESDLGRCIDACTRALGATASRTDPLARAALSLRAQANHARGDFLASVRDYTLVIEANPGDGPLYHGRAREYMSILNPDGPELVILKMVREDVERCLRNDPRDENLLSTMEDWVKVVETRFPGHETECDETLRWIEQMRSRAR